MLPVSRPISSPPSPFQTNKAPSLKSCTLQWMVTFGQTSCQCQTYPPRIKTMFCQKFFHQHACTLEERTTRAKKLQQRRVRMQSPLSQRCIRGLDKLNVWLRKTPRQGLTHLLPKDPSSRLSKIRR